MNGGFDNRTFTFEAAAADVHRDRLAVGDGGALTSVSINASAMPTFKVGEKVPDVVTPIGVSPSSTVRSGPQHSATEGPQPAQHPLRTRLLLRQQRVASPERALSSTRSPTRTAPAAARCPVTVHGRAADNPFRCAACRGLPARPAHRRHCRRRRRVRQKPRRPDPTSAAVRSRARRCSRCGTPGPATPPNSASAYPM